MEAYRRGGCRLGRVAPAALLVVALALTSTVALAATSASKAAAAPNSGVGTGRERLPGHQGQVPPGATLIGPAPAATPLPLDVTLKPRDPAALAAEVQAISDPGSPEYRHFLTPAQFAQQFGPTASTIEQVTSALQQEGLTVGPPSSTGLSLPVSSTVAQVQSAFSTPISKYHLSSGKTGYDNAAAPEVPSSVAPQIEGILGLDTLSPPQPSTSVPQASPAASHPEAAAAPEALAPGQPSPVAGSCANNISVAENNFGALDAPELAQAYSFDPLYSANDFGAGSTVALVEPTGAAGYTPSDINIFANCYGITLGSGQITPKDLDGVVTTGPGTAEAELDIETVLSLAPKANIEVYEGGTSDSLYDVFNQIVSDDTAKIVSASWTNGCEAYIGQSLQNSENTLFQAAAAEGQSIFVASGDQGSEGCNINGKIAASTGSNPVAQAVDPSTGTLYIANESSNTVSVDSEGSTSSPTNFGTASSVTTGTGPDAVALDAAAKEVFVANSGGTLTVIPTTTCSQSTTSGCSSPTQVASGGHLNAPSALAVSGSTLYVGNGNGTVAVYSIGSTLTWMATVRLPSGSAPTALAVDPTNGYVYVADGTNNKVDYFNATTCSASVTSGCSSTPSTVSVGNDPVALAVAPGAGDLYVANAGSGGGISVIRLSTRAVLTTIPTSQPNNGTGVVQSIGLSPDGTKVLAVLNGLDFPPDVDVLATINTTTQSITSTVNLESGNLATGSDSMGQLVSDGTLGYVWVTDSTGGGDVLQNLNLAVSDPASQPYVTAVGGTSFGHGTQTLGPPPTEQAWNDALYFSEGAGGGGISKTFTMPAYQQALGTVSGSSGTPCANAGGDCREVPDVSADADPSSGYVIYDSVNSLNWSALGGTSGAVPLWAAVVAVVASANSNTTGYGALNPALYLLAKQSPGTFLNDVTTGNNDFNATDGGQFPALAGYDMATGLGTPVASTLATGLASILRVAVSGTQTSGGSPTFTAVPDYSGPGTMPPGVTLNSNGLSCTTVAPSTTISPTLAPGSYTLLAESCGGLTLSGAGAGDYTVVYTTAANDFAAVAPAPPPTYGYWLVGSDGGIFTFGSANFYGSTGSIKLQRPVVGISPTADKGGYWLVASDGGVFTFGDAGFFGSIPGLGLNPAGSGLPHSLNAPVVGMVPSSDGGGYFMVASDGGVFTFGDARFEGSCPGISGGCAGAGVAVVPDASGNGYWLITQSGNVYTFGDAPFYGSPGGQGSPVTSAVRTADGRGYWILLANGTVDAYGDAVVRGSPVGSVGGSNPATAIFADADGKGYWVASALGAVFSYGDAPNDGSLVGIHLNGSIIAATGF
jgi:DNA-binding beta-propeller fold protein YncE